MSSVVGATSMIRELHTDHTDLKNKLNLIISLIPITDSMTWYVEIFFFFSDVSFCKYLVCNVK